jgi:hypothetical protein
MRFVSNQDDEHEGLVTPIGLAMKYLVVIKQSQIGYNLFISKYLYSLAGILSMKYSFAKRAMFSLSPSTIFTTLKVFSA